MGVLKTAVLTLTGAAIAAGIVAAAFIWSGVYDIAASRPHLAVTRHVLLTLKHRAVGFHARNLEPPDLNEPEMIKRGFVIYREHCVDCHGAPGKARSRSGIGLNPVPPPLVTAAERFSAREIAWITANGLKMAGMPAFRFGESAEDLWALTAFVIRMNHLTPDEYRHMERSATEGTGESPPDLWAMKMRAPVSVPEHGSAEQGRHLAAKYGCADCHVIPGVDGSQTSVGPPLTSWRKQHYISGLRINTPDQLVEWLMNPSAIEPDTAMPDLDLSREDAWHITAYLFSDDVM